MNKISISLLITVLLLGAMGAYVAYAFGFFHINSSMSWKEEVVLHNGERMVVERFYHLGNKPTYDSHERRALDETVSFTLPGSDKKISWKSDFRDYVPEPNSLSLLLLDRVNGIPFLAAYPAGCIAYNKWGRPNPPYLFFKYEGGEWKRIPLEEFPVELNRVNVIVGRPPSKLLNSFYSADQVEQQNHDIHTKAYKTIIRTPLKPGSIGVSCEVMINYKCNDVHMGWGAPGNFNKLYFEKKCEQNMRGI